MVWAHFLATEMLLLAILLLYCTIREIIRVIGRDRARAMFFGPLPMNERTQYAAVRLLQAMSVAMSVGHELVCSTAKTGKRRSTARCAARPTSIDRPRQVAT